MEPDLFDNPLNGAEELAAVLDYSGVPYIREEDLFRFCFAGHGCRWQMIGQGVKNRVLIYAIHPTPVTDRTAALDVCSRINTRIVTGSWYMQEERLVFRTDAHLIEACAAREMILNALEYSAAVMTTFWNTMAQGATGRCEEMSFDAIFSRFGNK